MGNNAAFPLPSKEIKKGSRRPKKTRSRRAAINNNKEEREGFKLQKRKKQREGLKNGRPLKKKKWQENVIIQITEKKRGAKKTLRGLVEKK